ncbi:MAG: YeeE/YedE thiosulfate transporter family protein [Acidobacteriota bacterium]
MHNFTPVSAIFGGLLIALAAAATLFLHGRLAGISGILFGLVDALPDGLDEARRVFYAAFLAGLVLGGVVIARLWPLAFESQSSDGATLGRFAIAGLLVGFGSRLSGGCTSGHGVCGLSLRSPRALVATLVFMAAGVATVAVAKHLLGLIP